MLSGQRVAALVACVALYIVVSLRNKRKRFVYSNYGITDAEVLRALEFANAHNTQRSEY